jgi:hypothetical protein
MKTLAWELYGFGVITDDEADWLSAFTGADAPMKIENS